MSSLGDQCHTKKLFVEQLGEDDHPIEMHVSKGYFKSSMQFVESDSNSEVVKLTSSRRGSGDP